MNQVRHFTQAYSQAPWRKQMSVIGLFLLVLVFVALIAGIYLSVTARAATIGREILFMYAEINTLELQNADLQNELGILKSSTVMEARARILGFERIAKDQAVFLKVPGYQTRRQPVMAPPPDPVTTIAASLPQDYTQSLVDWFEQQLPGLISRWQEVRP